MTDPMDQDLGELAIEEGRITLDNQFQLFKQHRTSAIDLVKLNFIIASVVVAAVGIGRDFIPQNVALGVIPLMPSALLALFASADLTNRDAYYGVTFDMEQLRAVEYDPTPVAKRYDNMAGNNRNTLIRENRIMLGSIGLLFLSLSYISVGFVVGLI